MTLYELTNEYQELLAMAEDPEIDQEVFADTLEGLEGEIEDKAEGYVCVIKELEAEADKYAKEIKRMSERCDSIDSRIRRMKDSLLGAMTAMGKTKVPTAHFKVSIVKNGGLQPLEIVGDVPEKFKTYRPEIDNKKIREALDAGIELDFAHYKERGTHLSIR